jgi:hypothetical protein
MLAIIATVLLAPIQVTEFDRPPSGQNEFYVGNRAPLSPQPFTKLPIGTIRPEGWLLKQLQLEAGGFVGHLESISEFLEKKNNAWLAADGHGIHGWEEVPYWLKGFGDLGYVLHDPKLVAEAKVWLDGVLSSSRPDGWFGPESNRTANPGGPDMWPNMAMLFALQSYYEVSHDPRVIKLMTAYFKYQLALPDGKFYQAYWEHQRGGDNMFSVYWLYNRTGDKWLLDLATKIHRRTSDWAAGVPNWHGVNFAQGFREPAEYALQTHDSALTHASEADYETMRTLYGQVPGGMYGADENARPGFSDPRQAAETCAMVEMMFSAEELLAIEGDPRWAERCEDVAFNSLPASMTADEKALHYLTSPNLIQIDGGSKAPELENGGKMLLFDPNDYRCCQHNVAQGWPYFAEHLWMATAGNGIAATFYSPSSVTARVGTGQSVTIEERTRYPFRDAIDFTVHASRSSRFPLTLRIPSWCIEPRLSINGRPVRLSGKQAYASIERVWKGGDVVSLKLPMQVKFHRWPKNHDAVSVDMGPLTYSLNIGEKVVPKGGTADWPAYEFLPTTPWNYGLALGASSGNPATVVKDLPFGYDSQPFLDGHAPVEILAYGRKVPAWQQDRLGLVGLLQQSPALSRSPEVQLTLEPMGASRLRISEFPVVSNSAGANKWTAPPKPRKPLPAQASHVFSGDTLDALSDGLLPSNSNDHSIPRFTWWDHKGSTEWVEYDLATARELSGVDVYWFDDSPSGGGCRVPASWRVLVLQGGEWSPIQTTSVPGTMPNHFNSISFPRIFTQRIRLEVTLQPDFSGGILEWKLRP